MREKVNPHSDLGDNVRSTRGERGSSTGGGKTMRMTPRSLPCAYVEDWSLKLVINIFGFLSSRSQPGESG